MCANLCYFVPRFQTTRNTSTNNSRNTILRGLILKLLKHSLHVFIKSVKKFSHFELQFSNGF